jgi:Polyketide cyclase / dehydrase and lipid transport
MHRRKEVDYVWSYEHGVETTAEPAAIWRRWADVERWPEWNDDIERIRIDGPFQAGSTISMTPRGEDEVKLLLAEVTDNELFVDEAQLQGLTIRTIHRIDPLAGSGVRVVYRMEITGPDADQLGPQLGPMISADFPQTIAELVRRAGDGAEA